MRNLAEIRALRAHFPLKKKYFWERTRYLRAVDGITLDIPAGRTLGLVGESGCGKTTAGKSLLGLYPEAGGSVVYRFQSGGEYAMLPFAGRSASVPRALRKKIQIIFQDPYSSLNPKHTVGAILSEGLRLHGLHARDRAGRVAELLAMVGLPADSAAKYPHEFSGGQRQRIGIARALSVEPEFIVCDEAVSALDVSVQAQIINLLMKLQRDLGLTYLFISHDLSVVRHISDMVAVMYLGRLVEYGPAAELFDNPRHPYTRALMSAIPGRGGERLLPKGDIPSPLNPPTGCHFHPRCHLATPECAAWEYAARDLSADGPTHRVWCRNI